MSVSLFASRSKLQAPGSAGCSPPGRPSATSPPQGPVRSGGPCSLRPSRSLFGFGFGLGLVWVGVRVRVGVGVGVGVGVRVRVRVRVGVGVRVRVRVRATYLSCQRKSVGKPSFSSAT